jgi:hypothetical protein
MRHTDSVIGELRLIEHAIRRLGALRPYLNHDECVGLAERLRDVCDELDHGAGAHLLALAPRDGAARFGHLPGGAFPPRPRIRPAVRPAKPRTMAGD